MAQMIATHGYIANTDPDWFSHFLHGREPPDEVNFWQLSAHGFKAIPPGAPRGSHGRVGGRSKEPSEHACFAGGIRARRVLYFFRRL
jgi:hypothetical protein